MTDVTVIAPSAVPVLTSPVGTDSLFVTRDGIAQRLLSIAALFTSPAFTGNPTVTTQALGDSSGRAASTQFVADAIAEASGNYQPIDDLLTSIADQSVVANDLLIGSGADAVGRVNFAANTFPARASTGALTAKSITDFSLGLLDEVDGAAWRSGIGAYGSGDDVSLDDATFAGNVVIQGDLTINGTATSVNTDSLAVEDSLIKVAKSNVVNTLDLGIYGQYQPGGTPLFAGLFKDASDSGKWKLFDALQVEPTTTVDTGGTGYTAGNLAVGQLEASKLTINSSLNSQIDLDGVLTDGIGTAVGLDMFLLSTSTANGSHSPNAARSVLRADVRSGVTNSGTMIAHRYILRRNDVATDEGALAGLTAMTVEYGHSNTAVIAPTTTTVHGIDLQPLMRTGSITTFYDLRVRAKIGSVVPTTYWGISHEDTTAHHQLVGRLALGQALGTAPTSILDLGAGTAARASLRLRSGVAPSSPNAGDIWYDGTDVVVAESIKSTATTASTSPGTGSGIFLGGIGVAGDAWIGGKAALKTSDALVTAHGAMGATETIDASVSDVHTGTLDAACTLTLSNPSASGRMTTVILDTLQDGTGGWAITWPGTVKADPASPSVITTANTLTRYVLTTSDAGANWIRSIVFTGVS